jgi:CBS domain-containing protein
MENPKHMSEITVDHIMTADVHTISKTMSVKEAVNLILLKKISGAPVLDTNHTVISVISEGTLLKLAAFKGLDAKIFDCLDQLPATKDIIMAQKHSTVLDVYKLFLKHHLHRIPIVDGTGKLQGIVSRSNVLRVFIQLGVAH